MEDMTDKRIIELNDICNTALTKLSVLVEMNPDGAGKLVQATNELKQRKLALDKELHIANNDTDQAYLDNILQRESIEDVNRMRKLSGQKLLSSDEVREIQEGSTEIDSTMLAEKRAMFKSMGISITEEKLRSLCEMKCACDDKCDGCDKCTKCGDCSCSSEDEEMDDEGCNSCGECNNCNEETSDDDDECEDD